MYVGKISLPSCFASKHVNLSLNVLLSKAAFLSGFYF